MNIITQHAPEETHASSNILQSVDLTAVIADFRRFSRFFAAIFVLSFIAIVLPILTKAPQYSAYSSVMIDPRQINAGPDQDVLSGLPPDTTTIDTEVEVLYSNSLADRVVKSMKLDQDPEFNWYLQPKMFGEKRKPMDQLSPQEKQQLHDSIVDTAISHVFVKRQGLTRIITITATSTSGEKAQKLANEWARLYLSQQLETKYQATKEANDWLNARLGDLKTQVEQAETAVQQYKIANGLMAATGDSTIAQTEISTLDQQLATVKVDQAESEARLAVAKRQLAGGSQGDDVGEALDSQVIKELRAQRAGVTQRLADLETRYGPLHPDIVKSKRQLDDIDAQINAEIKRIMSNLEAQAQIQRQRASSLAGSVSQARGALASTNTASVKLNELQRNADAVSSLYQSYLDRFKQTSSQAGLDKTDARIVSNATLPGSPSSPKVPMTLAIGLLGALGIASGAVLTRRALDSGLTTGQDVEQVLGQPYLAGVATLGSTVDKSVKTSPTDYVVEKPLSVFAEGFRSLRASLLYTRLGEQVKVVAVTSSLPGEGKTTTSVCLARTAALSGQSVVIVDCDLRRRSINAFIGRDIEAGLLEVLAGSAKLDDVLVKDEASGAYFLPLAPSAYTPKDVFGLPVMDKLLDTLRGKFDLVILDTAPVLAVSDTRILARKADIVAMLVRWRKTQRKAVSTSIGLLEDTGARVGGVVLTQVDVREQTKYGYGDSGYYYKQYKKYYTE
ncbi:MAG: polysaccharide biosynthesis tyrosine autokinase [Asticcacaulis sp.]|nr:polysaccharide biosynthesis tyrosine autokinase [Asticcacaulis sp.]